MHRKGYGRIYVRTQDEIEKVKAIIKNLDEFEYGYMPKDLITTFDQYPKLVYLHKFDRYDTQEISSLLWENDIPALVLDQSEQYPHCLSDAFISRERNRRYDERKAEQIRAANERLDNPEPPAEDKQKS